MSAARATSVGTVLRGRLIVNRLPYTLVTENDGCQCGRTHWCRLAIYAAAGTESYLGVIQFYSHPAKEPFQAAQQVDSVAGVMAFFLSCDPVRILRANVAAGFSTDEIHARYDFQVRDLLADFCRTLPGDRWPLDRLVSSLNSRTVTFLKGARLCFAEHLSLAV